ncbi:MAG TPA: hypothetical protein VIH57_19100 [Bacteroidales bacterium]
MAKQNQTKDKKLFKTIAVIAIFCGIALILTKFLLPDSGDSEFSGKGLGFSITLAGSAAIFSGILILLLKSFKFIYGLISVFLGLIVAGIFYTRTGSDIEVGAPPTQIHEYLQKDSMPKDTSRLSVDSLRK